ncbi:uncharacterized protein At5g41620-like [Coffea arabica]|uniref:Uncharacterized protein At5g41620-like n=1 Tax=Coffea arabica TaxID=13443 RepID=A0A6P6VZF7_COFAR|nr:uncharacterized protein At5g41620-like [Coffea arabica]
MEKEEKGRERDVKKEEFLGLKLKRGMLVGKRGGNTTPSPTWRYDGLTQSQAAEGSRLQDFSFPSNFPANISARQLGANLWEVQPHMEVVEMSKGAARPLLRHKNKVKDKGFELPKTHFDQPPHSPQHQPPTESELKKRFTKALMQHDHSAERNGRALPPETPGSSSSKEMTPYRPDITPTGALHLKGRLRESSYNLKTSTELLKVLNRIWSLEEQHSSNISLLRAMKKELDHARAKIKELLQEKKRHRREMEDMMRQLTEDKLIRKHKEEDDVEDTFQSMRNEIEDERKLRKHSESLHRKSTRELADVKSSFSNAVKELERERKARILLEDLCDEFAKGIRDYEQEIRLIKKRSEKDWTLQEHADRLILHISEAWLDERMQMKLVETRCGLADKRTIVDKLSIEIETFLQTKKSVSSTNDDMLSSKIPAGSHLRRYSLESFHLNEPGSAPLNADEEDYVDSGLYCSQLKRGSSKKESNCSSKKQSENAPAGHLSRIVKSNHIKKKLLSQEHMDDSDHLHPELQSKEQSLGDLSCNKNGTQPVNKEPAPRRMGNPVEMNAASEPCLSCNAKQHQENNHAENSFDPSLFTGPASPVEKWTSKVQAVDLEAPESSSQHQGIKENTLKAKLLEARLESRQSRSRASKVL